MGSRDIGLDGEGFLRVPKPEPVELSEGDRVYIPSKWGWRAICPLCRRCRCSGSVMVVESVVDGLGRDVDLIEGLLDYVVGEVPEEVAFNVCFVEDAPSVLDYQRRAD